MFDIGWSELLLIGGVALVVIGPKDLPRALRTLGQTTAKVRRMAADFQRQFNEAVREADVEEFRKGVSDVVDTARDLKANFNPMDRLRDEIKGAIDDSGKLKPDPSVEIPSAGEYLASLPPEVGAPDFPEANSIGSDASDAAKAPIKPAAARQRARKPGAAVTGAGGRPGDAPRRKPAAAAGSKNRKGAAPAAGKSSGPNASKRVGPNARKRAAPNAGKAVAAGQSAPNGVAGVSANKPSERPARKRAPRRKPEAVADAGIARRDVPSAQPASVAQPPKAPQASGASQMSGASSAADATAVAAPKIPAGDATS